MLGLQNIKAIKSERITREEVPLFSICFLYCLSFFLLAPLFQWLGCHRGTKLQIYFHASSQTFCVTTRLCFITERRQVSCTHFAPLELAQLRKNGQPFSIIAPLQAMYFSMGLGFLKDAFRSYLSCNKLGHSTHLILK